MLGFVNLIWLNMRESEYNRTTRIVNPVYPLCGCPLVARVAFVICIIYHGWFGFYACCIYVSISVYFALPELLLRWKQV